MLYNPIIKRKADNSIDCAMQSPSDPFAECGGIFARRFLSALKPHKRKGLLYVPVLYVPVLYVPDLLLRILSRSRGSGNVASFPAE